MSPKRRSALSALIVLAVAGLATVVLRDPAPDDALPLGGEPPPAHPSSAPPPGEPALLPADPAAQPDLVALRRACAASDSHACHQLSMAAISDQGTGALPALSALCRHGVTPACLHGGVAARAVGDLGLAVELLALACDAGLQEACDLVRKLTPGYDPAAEDRERLIATRLEQERLETELRDGLALRCAEGEMGACDAQAGRAFDALAPAGAAAAALPGVVARCEAGDTRACLLAVQGLAVVDPSAAPERLRVLDLGCDGGLVEACELAAKARGEVAPEPSRDEEVAMMAAEARQEQARILGDAVAACQSGDATACRQQGWMLAQGNGAAPDVAAARRIFEAQCDADDSAGCFALAMLLRSDGSADTAASLDDVIVLFERSCSDGIAEACDQLEKLGQP